VGDSTSKKTARRVIRQWRIKVPCDGSLVHIPVMSAKAQAVKAWGKRCGFVDVLDEAAGNMANLDDTPFELTLRLVEQDFRFEQPVPDGRLLGRFWSDRCNTGFYVFTVPNAPRCRTTALPAACDAKR